jgi:hypothetical protein
VGPPVHFTANVGPNQALPQNGSIELTFDRLLLPLSAVRQTFQLQTLDGRQALTPNVAYDPVSRVVTVTPTMDDPVMVGQTYQLIVNTPQSGITGLLAIDGATLDPSEDPTITFLVAAAGMQIGVATVDYCLDINPIFQAKCGGLVCHSAPPSSQQADGLVLTSPSEVTATAIGRVAVGTNTGPRPIAEAPSLTFGLDMPIIDPGPGTPAAGNPSDSWMMYKLLMAVPSPGDAGGITPLSDSERAILASLVPGREMPFPANPAAPLTAAGAQLTVAQLELVSTWIAQGAVVSPSCQ